MKLLILPGNSPRNQDWADSAGRALGGAYPDQYIQHYDHWQSGKEVIDLDRELEKLATEVEGQEYIIVGKSAGAMLAIYGAYLGRLRPKSCVFVGLPIKWFENYNFDYQPWLRNFNIPTVVIQNNRDPITNYEELRTELEQLGRTDIEVIKTEGQTHDYEDFDLMGKYLNQW